MLASVISHLCALDTRAQDVNLLEQIAIRLTVA